MDIVRRNIQRLGGRITIRSTPGIESIFYLSLPLTLAVLDGMVVKNGGETYVVPLSNMVETLRPQPGQVRTLVGGGDVLSLRGEYVPMVYLHRKFGVSHANADISKALVMLVETDAETLTVLMKACMPICVAARRSPCARRRCCAAAPASARASTRTENSATISRQSRMPNSSPTTAKTKSVCESGSTRFMMPSPGPVPDQPPRSKDCIAVTTWKLSPLSGSRKRLMRPATCGKAK